MHVLQLERSDHACKGRFPHSGNNDTALCILVSFDPISTHICIYIYIYIYAMCMRRMLALSCTGNKLGLMLYLDGITPGNPLAPVIARKCIAWHASFIELDELLTNEAYWLVVAIARTVHAMHLLSDMCLTRAIPQSGNSDTALCAITHPDRVPER